MRWGMLTIRGTAGRRTSSAEALAAAAGLARVRIVEAQSPSQSFLHQVESRPLDERQAFRIDRDSDPAAREHRVARIDHIGVIDAIAEARAAGGAGLRAAMLDGAAAG